MSWGSGDRASYSDYVFKGAGVWFSGGRCHTDLSGGRTEDWTEVFGWGVARGALGRVAFAGGRGNGDGRLGRADCLTTKNAKSAKRKRGGGWEVNGDWRLGRGNVERRSHSGEWRAQEGEWRACALGAEATSNAGATQASGVPRKASGVPAPWCRGNVERRSHSGEWRAQEGEWRACALGAEATSTDANGWHCQTDISTEVLGERSGGKHGHTRTKRTKRTKRTRMGGSARPIFRPRFWGIGRGGSTDIHGRNGQNGRNGREWVALPDRHYKHPARGAVITAYKA